jgi:hypothetical protein
MKLPIRVQNQIFRRLSRAAVVAALFAACASAQPDILKQSRVGFYGASVSTEHYFNPTSDPYALSYSQLWRLRNDTLTTARTSVGGTWARPGQAVSLLYTPSYTRSSLYPASSRLNHSFSLNGLGDRGIRLGARWRLSFGLNVSIADFQNLLMVPSSYSRVALSGATADELADGALYGKFSDPELAGALTGSAVLEDPSRLALFGNRMLTAAGRTTLTYGASPRLHFSLSTGAARSQHLNFGNGEDQADNNHLIHHSTYGQMIFQGAYALSERSQIGFSAGAGRTFSSLQRTWSSTGSVNFSRRLGPNWFFSSNAGAGRLYDSRPGHQDVVHFIGSATLGYSVGRHSFILSGGRTLSEELGAGAGSGVTARAGWSWQPGHTSWRFYADGGRQTWTRYSNPSLGSWRTTGGVGRRLPGDLFWTASVSYVDFLGDNRLGGFSRTSLATVRTTITWNPTNLFLK